MKMQRGFPFVLDFQEHNQEPPAKERVNLLQDFTQPAGETQSESVIDSDLVTLHFSVNGKCIIF